jgi:6-pyruvoyltetrahydropterin/6-carboxytetrahydropterin synthase
MYRVAVKRDFIAQHFLTGGDWGPENQKHSHHYQLELELAGDELDAHGFLVDILDMESQLEKQVGLFWDKTLNDLPQFTGLNPSIEHFSSILCQSLSGEIHAPNIRRITVKLWENAIGWASFELER